MMRLLSILAALGAAAVLTAEPVTLFHDGFSATPGTAPATPPWTSHNSDAHPDHEAILRLDTENLFGRGTDNRYLEFRDASPAGASLVLQALHLFEEQVVTLGFLVHEPDDPDYPSQLTIQLFAGNGNFSGDNRAQVLRLRNGSVPAGDTGPQAFYGVNNTRRIDFVVNNGPNSVTYHETGATLAPGLADVWIDGERLSAGYRFARGAAGGGPVRGFAFSVFANHDQRIFLDDVTVFAGAVVGEPLDPPPPGEVTFPLRLEIDREPSDLFGYNPDHTQNIPAFDSRNRPYIRSRGTDMDETAFIHTLENGEWVELDFLDAVRQAYPGFSRTVRGAGWITERLAFDRDDRAYMYLKIQLTNGQIRNLLLFSEDYCRTWAVREMNNGGDFAMEFNSGHNELDGAPFFLLSRNQVAQHPSNWAAYHAFYVLQPTIGIQGPIIPPLQFINNELLSIGQHSGGSNFSATRNGKTHFFWIEPTLEDLPGTPTYAAVYDHATRTVGPKTLVAYAPPVNNSHNRPGVVMDSEGYLHLVTGSHHGQNFYYLRSLEPENVYGGWTDPEPVWGSGWRATNGEDRGGQTYVSLICDPDDTLHLVFRQWRNPDEFFPTGSYYAGLSHQRKPKGGDWTEPKLLVAPERERYAIYYQKLAVDRLGRLFVSFSHFNWSMDEAPEHRYQRRMVILSDDGGDTWRLAETEDFDTPAPITRFEDWQREHFTPFVIRRSATARATGDPTGEGIANLLRYALGLTPFEPARTALPAQGWRDGRLELAFPRRRQASDLVYTVEYSDDLLTWRGGPETVDMTVIGEEGDFERVRASAVAETGGQGFLRLRVARVD